MITGFFMAWGCFSTIPCPFKRWKEENRKWMLATLPLIGLMEGLLWFGIAMLSSFLDFPLFIKGLAITLVPILFSGGIHLDGFMDCSDAIYSRRPLEEKQRILKDSTVGAFAVIAMVLMGIGLFATSVSLAEFPDRFLGLILIPVGGRAMGAMGVLVKKPLSTSQYEKTYGKGNGKYMGFIFLTMILGIILTLLFGINLRLVLSLLGALLGSFLAMTYASRQLGGMNGDIAGYAITWGEFIGLLTLVLI